MHDRRMIAFLYHFSKAIITLLLGAKLLLSSDIALANLEKKQTSQILSSSKKFYDIQAVLLGVKAVPGSVKTTYSVSINSIPYYPKSISKDQGLIKGVIDGGNNNNLNKLGRRLC